MVQKGSSSVEEIPRLILAFSQVGSQVAPRNRNQQTPANFIKNSLKDVK